MGGCVISGKVQLGEPGYLPNPPAQDRQSKYIVEELNNTITQQRCEEKSYRKSIIYKSMLRRSMKPEENLPSRIRRSKVRQSNMKYFNQSDLFPEEPERKRQIIDQGDCGKAQKLHQVSKSEFTMYNFHNCIGALISVNPYNRRIQTKGTAVVISADMILTCAHNFYQVEGDFQTKDHKFYLAPNGQLSDPYEIKQFYYPDQYQTIGTVEYDFAIAKLTKKITSIKDTDYLSLGFGFNDLAATLSIFGYPKQDNYEVTRNGGRSAYQKGLSLKSAIRSISQNEIQYEIPTSSGQSGSPIITGANSNIIVGIHKAAGSENGKQFNFGRCININMILRMEIWRQNRECDKFRVVDTQTNREIDLDSPLLLEMKKLLAMEMKKQVGVKNHYQRNRKKQEVQFEEIQNLLLERDRQLEQKDRQLEQKDIQLGQKEQQLRNIQMINQNLRSSILFKKTDLARKSYKINELKSLNNSFKQKLQTIKTDIKFNNPEVQLIQNANSQSYLIIKCLDNLQQQLRTQRQTTYKVAFQQSAIQSGISDLNGNFPIQWDPNCQNARKFRIQSQKLELVIDDSMYQAVSLHSFPKNMISTVVFELGKYGGEMQICIGILCQSRRGNQLSGRHKESVGYFTKQSKSAHVGWIIADEDLVADQRSNLFIREGEQLEMTIDLQNNKLFFKNRKPGGGSFELDLPQTYKKQKVYAFCNMYCKGDMIKAIY